MMLAMQDLLRRGMVCMQMTVAMRMTVRMGVAVTVTTLCRLCSDRRRSCVRGLETPCH